MNMRKNRTQGTDKAPGTTAAAVAGTDAEPFTNGPKHFSEKDDEIPAIRQSSLYNEADRARIDNNQFFETRSNPLSSKGN